MKNNDSKNAKNRSITKYKDCVAAGKVQQGQCAPFNQMLLFPIISF